jgi:hypothetical protein
MILTNNCVFHNFKSIILYIIVLSAVFEQISSMVSWVVDIYFLVNNCRVHNWVLKILSLNLILNYFNPVHTFKPYFSSIHFNTILPSIFRSLKCLSSLEIYQLM